MNNEKKSINNARSTNPPERKTDMNIDDFLNRIETISKADTDVKLYPYTDGEKLYSRFLGRLFCLNKDVMEILNQGWLWHIYKKTNGIDLKSFYIVPFNNYFNKKDFAFDQFYNEWCINPNNPNEILAEFAAFMTDGKTIIGFLENLKDTSNNHFIAIAKKKGKSVTDTMIIASNIYVLLDYVIEKLAHNEQLEFTENIDFWRSRDSMLDSYYEKNLILEYKLRYLWDNDSYYYKKYSKETTT